MSASTERSPYTAEWLRSALSIPSPRSHFHVVRTNPQPNGVDMSFSFGSKAPNKAAARAKVAEELSKVVVQQAVHALDRDAIEKAVNAHLDLLGDPTDEQDISISVNGSISAEMPTAGPARVVWANVGVSVGFTQKEQPQA